MPDNLLKNYQNLEKNVVGPQWSSTNLLAFGLSRAAEPYEIHFHKVCFHINSNNNNQTTTTTTASTKWRQERTPKSHGPHVDVSPVILVVNKLESSQPRLIPITSQLKKNRLRREQILLRCSLAYWNVTLFSIAVWLDLNWIHSDILHSNLIR